MAELFAYERNLDVLETSILYLRASVTSYGPTTHFSQTLTRSEKHLSLHLIEMIQ